MGPCFTARPDAGTGGTVAGHRVDSTLGPSNRLGVSAPACGYNARHSVRSVNQARFPAQCKKANLTSLKRFARLSAPSPIPEGGTHGTAYAFV
ncbi:hypothetical protein PLUA15_70070 [Pseudomonas lundensis]|uniref:Diguanylate cyclase n=1 Tax=Pseudomonas lundensis TaxID=86185 RepID=A0AAX2HFA3_9PSED|nr:hypothetical protein PLUA15_70070 [Pseudomonas lundensis]